MLIRQVSFLEVYNEVLTDLLEPDARKRAESSLRLVDVPDRGTVCQGLTQVQVSTLEEVRLAFSRDNAGHGVAAPC